MLICSVFRTDFMWRKLRKSELHQCHGQWETKVCWDAVLLSGSDRHGFGSVRVALEMLETARKARNQTWQSSIHNFFESPPQQILYICSSSSSGRKGETVALAVKEGKCDVMHSASAPTPFYNNSLGQGNSHYVDALRLSTMSVLPFSKLPTGTYLPCCTHFMAPASGQCVEFLRLRV